MVRNDCADGEMDEAGERLIQAGLTPNGFVLDLNGSLSVPHDWPMEAPWNLPSRLFRFPIEVSEAREGQPRRIGLMHPELSGHPFVRHIEALGFEVDREGAPNAYGYSKTSLGLWWHAVDLISAGKWRELIETRSFTTDHLIAQAVGFGLHTASKHFALKEAREIMRQIGHCEPPDRRDSIRSFMAPSLCNYEGKSTWPVNLLPADAAVQTWGIIHAVEDGSFHYGRNDYLQWADEGRELFHQVISRAPVFLEPSGQMAFAL